jgi:uncharacterized protein YukE
MTGHQGDYGVDPEQLRVHATSLAGYADQLATVGTGLSDSMGEQSLGSFAQFLTAGLGGAMTATRSAFADAAATVDKVGAGMRQAADQYQRTDEDGASGFTNVGETLS